ncbi:uncharacterized protein si:dkey-106l3.7 [Amphiprion ocellaris]|uniref:uncharacterized protein si:dkey-106l3.7 n=1 Tax=Amphiprion ocellaris TaxID=80972 RepID=UPI00241101C5|nr:uncharacterized protein si:dkey-106l3.7 [Amphiprion ocellaris]
MTAWVVQTAVPFLPFVSQQQRCEEPFSEMNLYRSFGNLMEAWLSEGNPPCPDSEWSGSNAEDSPTPSPENLRSESVDSGVETASCDMSSPAASPDNTEMDLFTPLLTPASTSQSPILLSPAPSSSSSSSPHLCLSRAEKNPTEALHSEQTLQRTDSRQPKENPKPLTVEEVLSRRPRASFLSKRQASELVRGQRSGSFGSRRTVKPSVPVRQMSEVCRRPLSALSYDKPRSEEGKELSPGLNYLEQVCQMLEEIARQQMHSRALQTEMDALCEDQDMEVADTCQTDSTAAKEDAASCQQLEHTENREQTSSEPQRRREFPYGHFRQRSASDTTLAALHLRRLNADCRGQHLSAHDLLEEEEEDHENRESTKKDTSKSNKTWRLRITSLRRGQSLASDTKGQQMQSSEKNLVRRHLSQLFRRRRKTLPV